MKNSLILSFFCAVLCFAAVSCRSSSGNSAEFGGIPEYLEFGDCVLSEPCTIVTPETLDSLPEPLLETARKHCGKSGTVVVVSSLRPRYFRLLRQQGLLLLGSVEVDPSHGTAFLCVLSGLGETAELIRSVRIENPESPEPWNLGVFAKRYPELTDRLNALNPEDERFEAAVSATRELLNRGSTRILLEKKARENADALDDAVRAEQEQIGVLEDILARD